MHEDKGTAGRKNAVQQSREQLYTVKAVNNWARGLNSAYRVSSCEPEQVFKQELWRLRSPRSISNHNSRPQNRSGGSSAATAAAAENSLLRLYLLPACCLDSKAAGTIWLQSSIVVFHVELKGLMGGVCRVYVGLRQREYKQTARN